MNLKLEKDTESNRINVFSNHGKKIGSFGVSEISQAFSWSGDEVIDLFLDVLTDCNYHSERKLIEQALNIER